MFTCIRCCADTDSDDDWCDGCREESRREYFPELATSEETAAEGPGSSESLQHPNTPSDPQATVASEGEG